MGNTARQKPRNVPKKKGRLKFFIVKSTVLRIISSTKFLALGLAQDGCHSDVRQWGWCMPDGPEDGCQEVWWHPSGLGKGYQMDIYMSQGITRWQLESYLEIYIDRYRTGKLKNGVFHYASTFIMLILAVWLK